MTPSPRLPRLLLALLLTFTAAVYAPNLDHAFQYDDEIKIVGNPLLTNPMGYFDAFFQEGYSEDTTRLIPNLSFCLDYGLNRSFPWPRWPEHCWPPAWDPRWFNVTNLLIHLINIWLVARLGRAVMRRLGRKESPIPLLAAALFAVHTLNSEAVNYCNARPNTLVTLFYLSALLAFHRIAGSEDRSPGTRLRRWGVFGLSFVGALFSKEFSVTLVLMMPLLLFWVGGDRSRRHHAYLRRRWYVCAELALVGVGVVFFTGARAEVKRIVVDVGARVTGTESGLNSVLYLFLNAMSQSQVLMAYFGLALLPLPRFLNADHEIKHLHNVLYPDGRALVPNWAEIVAVPALCFAAILGLIAAALFLRRRFSFATFFVLWPLIAHAPTSTVPRGEAMVEYRTYLPMVGVCLLLAWAVEKGVAALSRGWAPPRPSVLRGTAATVLVAALTAGTLARNPVWKTPVVFWRDIVQEHKSPGRYRAWLNYGKALEESGTEREAAEERKAREDAALAAYERSEREYRKGEPEMPGLWQARNNRGFLLLKQGRYVEARRELQLALDYGSTNPLTHMNMAVAYGVDGQIDKAIDWFREAIAHYPFYTPAHERLAEALHLTGREAEAVGALALARAIARVETRHFAEAERGIEDVLRRHPASVEAHYGLGVLLLQRGEDPSRGAAHLERAIELGPAHPAAREARRRLAELRLQQRRLPEALRLLEDLVQQHPDDFAARIHLGFLYLERDPARAEPHLRRAIALRPDHPLSKEAQRRARLKLR